MRTGEPASGTSSLSESPGSVRLFFCGLTVDSPEILGLHPNADLTFRLKEVGMMLTTLGERLINTGFAMDITYGIYTCTPFKWEYAVNLVCVCLCLIAFRWFYDLFMRVQRRAAEGQFRLADQLTTRDNPAIAIDDQHRFHSRIKSNLQHSEGLPQLFNQSWFRGRL